MTVLAITATKFCCEDFIIQKKDCQKNSWKGKYIEFWEIFFFKDKDITMPMKTSFKFFQ
jgi:hypothetical protein